jgi:hypothetical protein
VRSVEQIYRGVCAQGADADADAVAGEHRAAAPPRTRAATRARAS